MGLAICFEVNTNDLWWQTIINYRSLPPSSVVVSSSYSYFYILEVVTYLRIYINRRHSVVAYEHVLSQTGVSTEITMVYQIPCENALMPRAFRSWPKNYCVAYSRILQRRRAFDIHLDGRSLYRHPDTREFEILRTFCVCIWWNGRTVKIFKIICILWIFNKHNTLRLNKTT